MSQLPDLSFELAAGGVVAGVDEAGRGPWAGEVVAGAVILDYKNIPTGLNDSKKLTKQKREVLYDEIMASAIASVGVASVEEIDHLNILGATKLAMQRAVGGLLKKPDVALIDGNKAPELPCTTQTIIGGDAKSLSIAAASIIAKVTRDRMMDALAKEFPEYGWERNAGYGTKIHQEALAKYGITAHHRRSFRPIRELET